MIQLMGTPSADQAANLFGARPNGKLNSNAEFDLSRETAASTRNGQNEEVDPSGQKAQLVALDLIAGLLPRPSVALKDLDFTVQIGIIQIQPADLVKGLEAVADPQTGAVDIDKLVNWFQAKFGIEPGATDARQFIRMIEHGVKSVPPISRPILVDPAVGHRDIIGWPRIASPLQPDPTGARTPSTERIPNTEVTIDVHTSRLKLEEADPQTLSPNDGVEGKNQASDVHPEVLAPGETRPKRITPQILEFLRKGGGINEVPIGRDPNFGNREIDAELIVKDGRLTLSRASAEALTPQNADEFAQRYAQLMGSRKGNSWVNPAWTGSRESQAAESVSMIPRPKPIAPGADLDLPGADAASGADSVTDADIAPRAETKSNFTFDRSMKNAEVDPKALSPESEEIESTEKPTFEKPSIEPQTHAFVNRADTARAVDRTRPDLERVALAGMREVAEAVQDIIAARRPAQVKVELTPPDFGIIEVSVAQSRDGAEIDLRASDEGVRQALNAHRHELVQSIEGRGIALGSLNVGHHSAGQGDGSQSDMRRDFQAAANMSAFDASAEPTSAPTRRSFHQGSVDYSA